METKHMMESEQLSLVEPERTIALKGGQRLILRRDSRAELLRIVGADGRVSLSIEIKESGPVLHFEGCDLAIRTDGDLAIEAGHLALHGRSGVSLTSDGDVLLKTAGDLHTEASECDLTATLGDVKVRANDDVKLNGERVMVNC